MADPSERTLPGFGSSPSSAKFQDMVANQIEQMKDQVGDSIARDSAQKEEMQRKAEQLVNILRSHDGDRIQAAVEKVNQWQQERGLRN